MNPWLAERAIAAVCRTFESDREASAALLQRLLEPTVLAEYGHQVMQVLGREVKRLFAIAPECVETIYVAAFCHKESSDEQTALPGIVLRMTSTRRQDYHLALFQLAKVYPDFLHTAPVPAARALVAVMADYVAKHHRRRVKQVPEEPFSFDGHPAAIRWDGSCVWDTGTYGDDEPMRMLEAFAEYLVASVANPLREPERRAVVATASRSKDAIVWRRLLQCGAAQPETLGRELRSLLWARPILALLDTIQPAGELLKAVFPLLDSVDRERIERVIIALPIGKNGSDRQVALRQQHRLLGCLAIESLVLDETRSLVGDLITKGEMPHNEPLASPIVTLGATPGPEELLAMQGLSVDDPRFHDLQVLVEPVWAFANKYGNEAASQEDVAAILPAIESLYAYLKSDPAKAVDPRHRERVWSCLASGCEVITRSGGSAGADAAYQLIASILLEASHHPEPYFEAHQEAEFARSPSWGRPFARLEAAQGLMLLAKWPGKSTPAILEAIERLSRDEVPAVRFQVTARLNALYETAPEPMWRLLLRLCQEEKNAGVAAGLLGPLERLAIPEPRRTIGLLQLLYERLAQQEQRDTIRRACAGLFGLLAVKHADAIAQTMLTRFLSPVEDYVDEVKAVALSLRAALVCGPVTSPDPRLDAQRHRAIRIISQFVAVTRGRLEELQGVYAPIQFSDWPAEHQKASKQLFDLANTLGMEVYFASGVFDDKPASSSGTTPPSEETELRRRFIRELAVVIDDLVAVGHPSTTYHPLELFEEFLPLDPRWVFLWIRSAVVNAARVSGFQYDSLAVELIVRLVRRVLAECRGVIREHDECRSGLIDMLDVLVRAGWPEAVQLTYRLQEIDR